MKTLILVIITCSTVAIASSPGDYYAHGYCEGMKEAFASEMLARDLLRDSFSQPANYDAARKEIQDNNLHWDDSVPGVERQTQLLLGYMDLWVVHPPIQGIPTVNGNKITCK